MLKKIHAAREFSTRATIKSMLYRMGKTTAVTLVSRTHLTEAVVLFILQSSLQVRKIVRDKT